MQGIAGEPESSLSRGEKFVEKQSFLLWLATPTWMRKPRTRVELARTLHVHPVTLSRWAHEEEFLTELRRFVKRALQDRYADVVTALCDKASSGDVAAIKTYLEFICAEAAPARIEVNAMGNTQINIAEAVRETEQVDALPGWLIEKARAKAAAGEVLSDAERNLIEQFGIED